MVDSLGNHCQQFFLDAILTVITIKINFQTSLTGILRVTHKIGIFVYIQQLIKLVN